jgi:hypothetical protein
MAELSIQPTTDTQSPPFQHYNPLQPTQPYLEPIGRGKDWKVKWQELKNEVKRRENNQGGCQHVGAESRIHLLDMARREKTDKAMTGRKEEWDTERQSGPYSSIGMRNVRGDIREGGVWQGK